MRRRLHPLPALVLCALVLCACAPMRDDVVAVRSHAFDRPHETSLGRAFAQAQQRHQGESGFRLLNNGVSALMTRAALIDQAEHSIDFQTFIFDADEVGAFILDHLMSAARRGVRVRILLDDYELGLGDPVLAHLDALPGIEVRLFNPFPDRSRWSRSLQMTMNMDRLGRRMHNKLLVIDGHSVLLGGRNIGNHYFEGPSESNFRDIELLASGPIAAQADESFDKFWNNPVVKPVKALGLDGSSPEAVAKLADLLALRHEEEGPWVEYAARRDEFISRVSSPFGLIWAPAQIFAEPPIRQAEGAPKSSSEIARAHAAARQSARKEVVYESAYFVPGDRGVDVLGDMTRRGVEVTVLTNSMASTDVVAVHAAYALYRPRLLENGIRLFEYRADARRPEPPGHRVHLGRSESALHAKIVVYDRRRLWVGSANFDPRSRHLNTEIGVMIDSAPLAEVVLNGIAPDFSPSRAWRLELNAGAASGPITWVGEKGDELVRLDTEPDADLWRGLKTLFYTLLPGIEELL